MQRLGPRKSHARAAMVLIGFLAGCIACAPTQVVPLEVAPDEVDLYLDGERLEEIPASLKLKSNRNHTLFFKREGYLSQFILLRSSGKSGDEKLSPDFVALELQELTVRQPSLSLEIEDEPELESRERE